MLSWAVRCSCSSVISPDVYTAICAGGGWGIGWLLAICAVAAIRERLAEYSNIPKPLRGIGITFILTALMGIAFYEFPRHKDLRHLYL